ncbi:probable protein phosphatase 2C 49 [Rosa rugosa]|uniref:probable protein phosphatase 2C 49 n=1 Tax=Rosa rugosa TaxID=74645 RepID=UPI002B404E40|nr:probable protein phosphatase 2C 49 [Rosa rugosa]
MVAEPEAKIMCPQNVEVFAKGMSVGEVEDVVASISPKSFDRSRPLEFVSPAAALISTSQPDVKPADKVSDLAPEPADLEFFPRLRSGSFADIGPRRYMEDEHILIDDLSSHLGSLFSFPTPSAFYGVFDGHGGPEAAAYVRKNVMRLVFDDVNFPQASEVNKIFSEELENTLRKAFHQVDLALADDCSVSSSSGTTALTAMIFGRLLMVANTGDCRAVLCRKGEAIDMSQDHRPIYPSERKRVEELGGYVDDGYLNGVLSVSRALGDWDMKFPCGSASPLIAEPEFRRMDLTEEDEFLIIGCDGIWDVMSSQHAVSLVRRGLRRHDDPEQCAKDLVMEALRLNTFDNLTVIVVCFSSLDQREPLSPPRERRFRCCSLSAEALCSLRSLLDTSG